MPGEIILTTALNRAAVYPTGQVQLLYVLVDVRPGAATAQARLPLNLSLVLDKSGSMAGEPIRHLREAVQSLIDHLAPDDVVSVITFETSPELVVAAQPARDKAALKRAVADIRAGGGTQMSAGMRLGLAELDKNASTERLSRMVLLTDGRSSSEKGCLNRADEAAQRGIPILGLGLGIAWNEALMEEMALKTGGSADYVAHPQGIGRVFRAALQSMQVVARNLRLTLRLVQGVEVRAVWQVVPDIRDVGRGAIGGRTATVPLSDLEAGGQSLLVELLLPNRAVGAYRVAQIEVFYDVPRLRLAGERIRSDVLVYYTPDYYAAQQLNPHVMNLVERLAAYRLQRRAMDDVMTRNLEGATQKLQAAATILLEAGEVEMAQTFQQEAERLRRGGDLSEAGRKTIVLQSGKTRKLPELD